MVIEALGNIRLCLAQSMTFNITKVITIEDLMKTLRKYKKRSASNKEFLMKCLFNMNMVEDGFVADHINEFNKITSQLSLVNINFEEEIRALSILCSLPESWNGLVMVVSNSIFGSNTLNFDDDVGVTLTCE